MLQNRNKDPKLVSLYMYWPNQTVPCTCIGLPKLSPVHIESYLQQWVKPVNPLCIIN